MSVRRPALIVVGGFAGSGKSTLTRRLSEDLGLPRLGADTIGRVIRGSEAVQGHSINAGWIAHDVVFGLCDDFLRSGVSTILDLNMGRAFQWQQVDAIARAHPEAVFLPIVLRCPREVCLERITLRHAERPDQYDRQRFSRRTHGSWQPGTSWSGWSVPTYTSWMRRPAQTRCTRRSEAISRRMVPWRTTSQPPGSDAVVCGEVRLADARGEEVSGHADVAPSRQGSAVRRCGRRRRRQS